MASPAFSNIIGRVRVIRPPPLIPIQDQFRHILACLIMTSIGGEVSPTPAAGPGLKKIPAYWYPYTTYAKERWLGRELLEVVSTEFRDRSMEYYVRRFLLSKSSSKIINSLSEVCIRIRRYHYKWASSKSRPHNTKWRSYGVRTLLGYYSYSNPSHYLSRNVVHRHEPPVSATPVRILLEDKEREFIVVDKPGSIVRSSIPVSTFDLS